MLGEVANISKQQKLKLDLMGEIKELQRQNVEKHKRISWNNTPAHE